MSKNIEIELIKKINEQNKEQNFTVSPIGLEIILSLLSNGAEGETQKEILQLLNYEDIDKANNSSKEIIDECQKNDEVLKIASAVLTKVKSKATFITNAREKYDAMIDELKNFETINNWAKKKTKNTINKIIESLPPEVLMILLNAIYFEAEWEKKFDQNLSYDREFMNLDKASLKVRTNMLFYRGESLNYYENDEIEAVKLNYKSKNKSIYAIVILPKTLNLNLYISNIFDKEKYDEIIEGLSDEKEKVNVNFIMPKFEMEYKIDFCNILKELGMKKAFTDEAELEGIYNHKSNVPIHVGQVIQKNFIKTNEHGTQGGSVTELDVILECYMDLDPQAKNFICNKPFLFIIRDEQLPKDRDIIFFTKFCKVEKNN